MDIVSLYFDNFTHNGKNSSDLELIHYDDSVYIGATKDHHCVVAIQIPANAQMPMKRKTKLISVECNMVMSYSINGQKEQTGLFHIIKCLSTESKDIQVFLESVSVMLSEHNYSKDYILETFDILTDLFGNNVEIYDNELIGYYGELYTIKKFHTNLNLERYWQSRDRLKFDFSISDKVKIEIKTTTKQQRIHHFLHEQIASNYHVYIVSYKLSHDDQGLSLLSLINECKKYLIDDPSKYIRLERIIKNVDENRLSFIKFEESKIEEEMRIYRGTDIPQFKEKNPEGVAHAEYDCDLENVKYISCHDFIDQISALI